MSNINRIEHAFRKALRHPPNRSLVAWTWKDTTRYRRTIHSTSLLCAAKNHKPAIKPKAIPAYKPSARKPPQPTQADARPKKNPLRYRSTALVIAGIAVFGMAAYGSFFMVTLTKPSSEAIPITASAQQDVSSRYDIIANNFDDEVDWTEWTMGITSLRKKMMAAAHGDVLEVSIGTGRNLEYYDWNFKGFNGVGKVDYKGFMKKGKVRSFTAVDKSEEMLEVAHEKFVKMYPGILGVRWVIADAAEKGKIPGPPKNANETSGSLDRQYDTVVQTFGLCSVSDPVGLLRNLGECVKVEEGRIFLLEHGRGRWAWLNGFLDKFAEGHAKQFGCWWNRDIREIVEESGLEVVKIETPKWLHGGTTWWVELKKPKTRPSMVRNVVTQVNKLPGIKTAPEECCHASEGKPTKTSEEQPTKKGWW